MKPKSESLDSFLSIRVDKETFDAYHALTVREKIAVNNKRRKALRRLLKLKS